MSLIGTTEVKRKLIGNIHLLREIPGFSAYELAVKNGYKGTEEEWLEHIKGRDGYTPVKGVDYFDGSKGEPGTLQSHTEVDALGHRVINVAEPEAETDGATKKYVDDAFSKVEDISENFASTINSFPWSYRVLKYGKLIFGEAFCFGSISGVGTYLFDINEAYLPNGNPFILNCHITDTAGTVTVTDDKTESIIVACENGSVRAKTTSDLFGEILINFIYICE